MEFNRTPINCLILMGFTWGCFTPKSVELFVPLLITGFLAKRSWFQISESKIRAKIMVFCSENKILQGSLNYGRIKLDANLWNLFDGFLYNSAWSLGWSYNDLCPACRIFFFKTHIHLGVFCELAEVVGARARWCLVSCAIRVQIRKFQKGGS